MKRNVGDTFGNLTIKEIFTEKSRTKLKMQCSCGNIIVRRKDYLNDSRCKTHCGCLDNKKIDLISIEDKFNRLTVISEVFKIKQVPFVSCRCECGTISDFRIYSLLSGETQSCGCFNKDILKERSGKNHPLFLHGDTGTKIHQLWSRLKTNEWTYTDFKKWYNNNYKQGYVLCKINDKKPYSPNNVKFVTPSEKSRIYSNQDIITINGKSPKQFSEHKGIAKSTARKWFHIHGNDLSKINVNSTNIEQKIEIWLKKNHITFKQNKQLGPYRPDFQFDNIVIECDGLYWHSDAVIKNKKYHQEKRLKYLDLGYNPLFFREDEILNKFDIVTSIINNKLKKNIKVFARKCTIEDINNDFFIQNHLMGRGQGKKLGLIYDNKIMAGLQYVTRNGITEISRFCTRNNYSVIGGFSKLLKKIPHPISTFIDLRYGKGDYLYNLGFIKSTEYLSFRWTNNKGESYHRLKFKGNSGYKNNMYKIWDCGQAKFIKNNL